jgi:hypothetical protein
MSNAVINPSAPIGATGTHTATQIRSIRMYSMYEALARDRMRVEEQRSRHARLASELAAQRRWHRVSLRARRAVARHARRVSELSTL